MRILSHQKDIATACLTAWTSGNFYRLRQLLHDDVTFTGPMGHTSGAEQYVDGVQQLSKMVDRADIKHVFAEDDDVCVVYDLVFAKGEHVVPTAAWYVVQDNRVRSVRAFFDARELS